MSLPDALRQVTAWADRETAIACLDTALERGQIRQRALLDEFRDEPAASRARAASARPGSDSGCESLVRQRLARLGIDVAQQVTIDGVGDVDMVVRGTRVVIEVDGYAFHGSRSDFEKDRRRDAVLVALGYVVVRLSYRQVMEQWGLSERAIVAAILQFRTAR